MEDLRLENIFLRIKTDKFYFLKFLLEAYDGLGILSSSGIRKDIVIIRYPAERRNEMFALLTDLAKTINPYR